MAYRVETNAEPIPGYRLIERIGGGGFGEVWKAEAPGGLLKAIKFVYGSIDDCGDEGMRAEQELKSLSRVKTIRHPYILSLERYEIVDGQLCIVMELADRNLWDRFKECRVEGLPGIPRDELLNYIGEIAEALDLMNMEYGLQHLDIKPQNLFLVHNHIKVADFGLVKDLEGMVAKVTGGVTPIYAAPETFDGWVSRFSDQYSLGIVYQELLTGHRPYSGTSVRQLIVQHMSGAPDLTPLPAGDRDAIARSLSKRPEDRFPTCRDLASALQQLRRGASMSVRNEPSATESIDAAAESPAAEPNGLAPVAENQGALNHGLDVRSETLGQPGAPADEDEIVKTHCFSARAGTGEASVAATPAPSERPRGIPPAVQGEGVLFPALVIGLGELGIKTVLAAREKLAARFGNLGVLAQLQFLGVDTSPEASRQFNQGSVGLSVTHQELLVTRLNRPSYYARNRDDRALLDDWLDIQMLYRIPRSLETGGVRALGRLAFHDHFTMIARVIRQALERCTEQDALVRASRDTKLGMRSNRPRVYVTCSMMGGTGSGMFIDTAYLVRSILRKMGYESPEVIGLFLLPHVDRGSKRALNLGNTYAALRELAHFSMPENEFRARYGDKEAFLQEAGPPYLRSFLLEMPERSGDQADNRAALDTAGEFLSRELVHGMGRTADFSRAVLPPALHPQPGPVCHAFGLHRFNFPYRQLVQESAGSVCRHILDRWISKDAREIEATIDAKVQQRWTAGELHTDGMIQRLLLGCQRWLQKSPEELLAGSARPVLDALNQFETEALAVSKRKDNADCPSLDVEQLDDLVLQIDDLLGKSGDEGGRPEAPPVAAALARTAEDLVAEIGQKLAEFVIALVEQPSFRLAGAEEAVRRFMALIEKTLEHHEPLCKELTDKAAEAQQQMRRSLDVLKKQLAGGRKALAAAAATAHELAEVLNEYPKRRYQSLLLHQFSAVYLSLRGNLSDLLHEINNCRLSLVNIRSSLGIERYIVGSPPAEPQKRFQFAMPRDENADLQTSNGEAKACQALFPFGCSDMPAAVARLLRDITPEELHRLDERLQEALTKQFGGLVAVCLASAGVFKGLTAIMQFHVEQVLGERLGQTDVGQLFLEQYPEDSTAAQQLEASYEKAGPRLSDRPTGERHDIAVLGISRGPAGDRIRELYVQQLGKNGFVAVPSDDVSVYRENSFIKITDLEQLGPLAQQAYRQMMAVEHFTPHVRADIQTWELPTTTPVPVGVG